MARLEPSCSVRSVRNTSSILSRSRTSVAKIQAYCLEESDGESRFIRSDSSAALVNTSFASVLISDLLSQSALISASTSSDRGSGSEMRNPRRFCSARVHPGMGLPRGSRTGPSSSGGGVSTGRRIRRFVGRGCLDAVASVSLIFDGRHRRSQQFLDLHFEGR